MFIILPVITGFFVNPNDYIEKSQTITIVKTNEVPERYDTFVGNSRSVFTIQNNEVYYELLYYTSGKYDSSHKHFNYYEAFRRTNQTVLKLNPIELKRHQGTKDDPIPVLNLAAHGWNDKVYYDNTKEYLANEYYWHFSKISAFLWFIMILGHILAFIAWFIEKRQSRRVRFTHH